MITKIYILFLFFIIISTSLFSQGLVESPLTTNLVLTKKSNQSKSLSELKSASIHDTIKLAPIKGILDDFSNDSPYPDTSIWLDNDVFINRTFGKAPISLGMATFDGLNADGYPYNFVVSNTSSASADSLTSKPIDLSPYGPKDSIYLSFFYQPQGLGDKPETADSLILEFKGPGKNDSIWSSIWDMQGSALAANDSSWHRVMIPITNTAFLKKGFQFRFRNYATLSGSLDDWHIDYVYLNNNRKISDTIFSDISWVYNGTSLLKNYQAMPWKQYLPSELRTNIPNLIRNNYANLQILTYHYKITNDTTLAIIDTFKGAVNIYPFNKDEKYTDCDTPLGCIDNVAINTNKFPAILTGPDQITIEHYYTKTLNDLIITNDTINVHQKFLNYYAYDDGTAESAISLSTLNSNLAEKYTLNVGDSLQCLDIYFNPIISNATLYAFSLNVWNDNGGKPGTVIFTSASPLTPEYNASGENKFTRYFFDAPLYLSAGTYYIGFTQITNQFLNVGEDKNINSQDKVFYNVGGGWNNSPFFGSLMMRPFFGAKSDLVGIENPTAKNDYTVSVYPNPANDKLFIKSNLDYPFQKISYTIVDLFGRTIFENILNISEYIDISSLADGVYFIRVTEDKNSSTAKFIKIN